MQGGKAKGDPGADAEGEGGGPREGKKKKKTCRAGDPIKRGGSRGKGLNAEVRKVSRREREKVV